MLRRRLATSTLLSAYCDAQAEHEVGEVVEVARSRAGVGLLNDPL